MVNQDYNENEEARKTTNPVVGRERDSEPDNTIAECKLAVANPDFSGKVPHFSAKHKIFLQAVKYAETALFARIQLGRSWARYPGRPVRSSANHTS
jgi:hypothetical protein